MSQMEVLMYFLVVIVSDTGRLSNKLKERKE